MTMLPRSRALRNAVAAMLAATGAAAAAPPRGPLRVSIEVIANPAEGPPRRECASSAIDPPAGAPWWVTFGLARPHPEKAWEAAGDRGGCGAGSPQKGLPDSRATTGAPYLTTGLTTVSGFLTSSLNPERVLLLEVSLSLGRLTGFTAGGEPVYERSERKRTFHFQDRRDAVIPLLVASAAERDAFGIREVLLKVTSDTVADESVAAYGVVSLTSAAHGGDVLLDGGRVATVAVGQEAVLRNVAAGVHELRVRGSSGNEARRAVRVVANRTVLVDADLHGREQAPRRLHLVSLGKNAQGHEEYRRESDGAVVVKVPAGEFLMGNRDTERTPLEHRVYVSDFLMDKLPVTWRQFKRFAAATGWPLPPHEPYWGMRDDHPAVFVTWEEARTYCAWAGGRLPTEAEREKGARGGDERKYPWGNEEPDRQRAVFRRDWGSEATEPVGTHPAGASPYGLLDVGGQVWEFCADWYDADYYAVSPSRDPKGPPSGTARVVRGGSWDSRPAALSASCRNFAYRGYREGDFGFRCAMDAPP